MNIFNPKFNKYQKFIFGFLIFPVLALLVILISSMLISFVTLEFPTDVFKGIIETVTLGYEPKVYRGFLLWFIFTGSFTAFYTPPENSTGPH